MLSLSIRRPPTSTRFPYTTLFRSYRIGAEESPPYMALGPDGTASGFVVDVINEAANRSGIKLKWVPLVVPQDRKSTRLNSSHVEISYAVFCLKKKKPNVVYLTLEV